METPTAEVGQLRPGRQSTIVTHESERRCPFRSIVSPCEPTSVRQHQPLLFSVTRVEAGLPGVGRSQYLLCLREDPLLALAACQSKSASGTDKAGACQPPDASKLQERSMSYTLSNDLLSQVGPWTLFLSNCSIHIWSEKHSHGTTASDPSFGLLGKA